MSKAKDVIASLQETKVKDIHKALGDLDSSSWNTLMGTIQIAIQSVTGETITTANLDKAFKRLIGRR